MKPRIVIADDNTQFLGELVSVLRTDFDVVETAADGRSALECILRSQPDAVVLDLEMPLLNGIEVTRELMKCFPGSPVVVCSVESDPEIVEVAQQAGVLGYVFKPRIHQDLILAVKAAVDGQSFVSPR
jgi:two-component system, NarL family, response regulator DegU